MIRNVARETSTIRATKINSGRIIQLKTSESKKFISPFSQLIPVQTNEFNQVHHIFEQELKYDFLSSSKE